jgi:antitoxin component of MazEF toxin-antitoxin module
MPTKLCKWGNSLGVRLPAYVVERAALHAGDYLFVRLDPGGEIIIKPVSARDIPAGYMPNDAPPKAKIEVLTDEEVLAKW